MLKLVDVMSMMCLGHGGGGDSVGERVQRAAEHGEASGVRGPAVADRAGAAARAERARAPAPAPAGRFLPARASTRPVPALLPRLPA